MKPNYETGLKKTTLKILFWDLGHTLARQLEEVSVEAVHRIGSEAGEPVTNEAYALEQRAEWRDRNHPSQRKVIKKVRTLSDEHSYWWDFYTCLLRRLNLTSPSEHLLLWLLDRQIDPYSWEWMPGAELASYRMWDNGIRQGIITNSFPSAEGIVRRLGMDTIADPIVYSHLESCLKPEKHIYQLAARRANVPLNQALIIDDRLEFCRGALKAGMNATWFNPARQPMKDWEGLMVEDLSRFEGILEECNWQASFFSPRPITANHWGANREAVPCQIAVIS